MLLPAAGSDGRRTPPLTVLRSYSPALMPGPMISPLVVVTLRSLVCPPCSSTSAETVSTVMASSVRVFGRKTVRVFFGRAG